MFDGMFVGVIITFMKQWRAHCAPLPSYLVNIVGHVVILSFSLKLHGGWAGHIVTIPYVINE